MGDPFRARPRPANEQPPSESAGETAEVIVETPQTTITETVQADTLEPVDDLPPHSQLTAMKKAGLQALARARGVSFAPADSRDELIEALEKAAGRR